MLYQRLLEWQSIYIRLFDFSKFSNDFELKDWIDKLDNDKMSNLINNYLDYMKTFSELLNEPSIVSNMKQILQNSSYKEFMTNGSYVSINNFFSNLKIIFDWYQIQKPLTKEEFLKGRKKILFSISNCHLCIFLNLGIYSILDEKILENLEKSRNKESKAIFPNSELDIADSVLK